MKLYTKILLLGFIILGFSCKKLINIGPPKNQLTPDKVFDNSSSVIAATVNMYTALGTVDANFDRQSGIYTDELITTAADATDLEFTKSLLTTSNTAVSSIWQNLYGTIYKANAVIEGLRGSTSIPDSVKTQCLGEALFLRAYCHFMLTNIYGDVPLIVSTDVTVNALTAKAPESSVYQQITNDLNEAVTLLPATYTGGGEKARANKWAASALLAKAYLFNKDYKNAENQANLVITSGQYSLANDLNTVFLADNAEAIWQLWNVNGYSPLNAVPASGIPAYRISASLFNSFEPNDQRLNEWVKSTVVSGISYYYPYKYKQHTSTTGTNAEYTTYLRLGELYLIRAEARVQQANTNGAISDLNIIRNRAGLLNTLATTQSNILIAIMHERQIELFYEGGNRFFDLKRFGTINTVMPPLKAAWIPTASLFPIPKSEIQKDPNLIQNAGYSN